MHENAQKFHWKTQSKIAYDFTCNLPVSITFSPAEFFELEASPAEKERVHLTRPKIKFWRPLTTKQICRNVELVERKAYWTYCHVTNAFLSRAEQISRLKTSKMSENAFLAKSSGSQWVKYTSLKLSGRVNLKCTELNPFNTNLQHGSQFKNVNQEVISAKSFPAKGVFLEKRPPYVAKTRPPKIPAT